MWHPPINQSAFSDISCQDTQILKVGPLWKQNFTGSNSLQTSCWTDAFNNLLKLRLTDANLRCHLDRIKRRGSCRRCWWAGRLTSGWSASCFLALSPRLTLLTDCLPSGELWKNVVFFPSYISCPRSLHFICMKWRDHKLLFSLMPTRHATVNKSLNHCRSGLGQRTIQKPLLQMAH